MVTHGKRNVFSYGTAKNDSIYEIGSVSKTFTGLAARSVDRARRGDARRACAELLPAGTVAKPAGREITLLDLVTQHSGLPRMPTNFKPASRDNPYVDYRAANLLRVRGPARCRAPRRGRASDTAIWGWAFSARRSPIGVGVPYEKLLQEQITGPLGLKDTVLTLSPSQQERFIAGYGPDNKPAHSWEMDALAGAGAIRSTASDMLTYLEAQLHPQKLPGSLPKAIAASHELRSAAGPGAHIGFAWIHRDAAGAYWHNGATGGYSSYAWFSPKQDSAFIVLVNRTVGPQGSFGDLLGAHITQRLAGEPAVSLN